MTSWFFDAESFHKMGSVTKRELRLDAYLWYIKSNRKLLIVSITLHSQTTTTTTMVPENDLHVLITGANRYDITPVFQYGIYDLQTTNAISNGFVFQIILKRCSAMMPHSLFCWYLQNGARRNAMRLFKIAPK
jgi:hypothetical protein